jgi:muramoyltetrapeptide carboxypeptidase
MSIQDTDNKSGRRDSLSAIEPPRLQSGDTVAVAAPAGLFDPQALHAGVQLLVSAGLQVMVPDEVFISKGRYAGDDRQRADLIMRLAADAQVKAIFCIRGGYGAMRILPFLDFDVFVHHPKIIVGFSDITALLLAVHRSCGMVTYHGPLVTTLAESDEQTQNAFFQALFHSDPLPLQARAGGEIKAGRAEAPVLAGNLTTLNHLLGTPYQPQFEGRILLLEDRAEAPYRIDRMLTQLKLAGCLDDLAGVGLGSFESCGDEQQLFDIVGELFADRRFPILARLPFGHANRNLTVPIGRRATIDTDRRTLAFNAVAADPAKC